MAKIDLSTISSGYNLSKINENFQKVEDALNNEVLYRDNPVGENNALQTDVDANNKRILNLPDPVSASEPIRKQEWDKTVGLAEQYRDEAEAAKEAAEFAQAETEGLLSLVGVVQFKGDYTPSTFYSAYDAVFDAAEVLSSPGAWYIAPAGFTSTNISADVAAGDLVLFRDKSVLQFGSISELQGKTLIDGQQISVAGYHSGSTGGGIFVWSTGRHNGGTFIDPNRAFPTDWSDQAQLTAWFADSGVDVVGFKRLMSGFVTPEMFGARGDKTNDDYNPIQSAINYAGKSSRGEPVQFGNYDYLYSQGLIVNSQSVELIGAGVVATRLYCTATSGAAIRLKKPWNAIKKMQINAFGDRLTSTDITAYGIQIESDDIPEDSTTRVQSTSLDNVEIINQPSHGLVGIGPALDGAQWNQVHSWLNGGHGIAIDRGLYTGRVNLPTVGIPGVLTINNARLSQNGGHGLACGHPSDAFSTPSLRVVLNNAEIGPNCSNPAVRHSLEQVWLRGTNHEINTPVFTGGSGTLGGVFAAGRNIHLRNLRAVSQTHTVRVGNFAELPTSGVYIDGISVINGTQDVAVILDSGVKNVRATTKNLENITRVMTGGVLGCEVYGGDFDIVKSSDQTISASTTYTDITEFTVPVETSSTYKFRAEIYYTSPAAADIKFNCLVPTGSTIRYSPDQTIKISDSDTVVADSVKGLSGDSVVFGGSIGTTRMAVVTGVFTTSTTTGNFRMQFAQVASDAGETIVYGLSSLSCKRIVQ